MEMTVVYERDLLYPTDNVNDPGCIHIEVLSPNKNGKMPVLIESKTTHSPVKYINAIIRIMQMDIFDRIHIEVKDSAKLFIKANDELKKDFQNKKYIKVIVNNDKFEYFGIDELE
jgi:hypothetical protein